MSTLLSVTDDVIVLIMDSLVDMHASPKSLLRFLVTTKRLCKTGCQMYDNVVEPFMSKYAEHLLRMKTYYMAKVDEQLAILDHLNDLASLDQNSFNDWIDAAEWSGATAVLLVGKKEQFMSHLQVVQGLLAMNL